MFSRVLKAVKAFQERRFVIIFSEDEGEADLAVPAQEITAEVHISAFTIKKVIDPSTKPSDLSRPGHLQLLGAHPDGLIGRNGHTEAVVELSRLAGLYPGGVLCELVSDTGDMMTAKELKALANRFKIPIITVGALTKFVRSLLPSKKGLTKSKISGIVNM